MLIELCRIGADVEVRFTPSGDAVANIRAVYSYGKKAEGKQPGQWIDATLWGKRAESLAPYLTKGALVMLSLEDVHIEEYQSNGETRSKLAGRVVDLKFAGGGEKQEAKPAQQSRSNKPSDPLDFDDSQIPF